MASSLTSASLKSGFLYLMFFVFIVLGTLYLLFFKQPSAIDNLNRQAFYLNSAAFRNGIILAKYKFETYLASDPPQQLDRWIDDDIGLDYNKNGYPIGINITNKNQNSPSSALDCQQVWQFVLGPLQPTISTSPNTTEYWVELKNNDLCAYHASNINNLVIFYHTDTGKVVFFEDNSLINNELLD